MKYKSTLFLTLILIIGLLLRLIGLDKPEGLWNDEYVSYMISSIPIGQGFFKGMIEQCHMPFYYLYLKFFIHFFGDNDILLRSTSVIAGVLSIVAMFFVGKQAKDEKTGLLCALTVALSSFLIYYSQEVRFYSLLFLFSAMLLLFTLRLNKKQSKLNIAGYVISSILVVFTHTIGFVFVVFNLIFTTYWFSKLSERNQKPLFVVWTGIIITAVVASPFILNVLLTNSFSQWWGYFTVSKLGFLITDYFSPILTNLVNAPDNFFYNLSIVFLVFGLVPSGIALFGIAKSLTSTSRPELQPLRHPEVSLTGHPELHPPRHPELVSGSIIDKKSRLGLFLICVATIAVLVVAALSGKLVFITKYSIEIYPTLILLMCIGLLSLKKSKTKITLIVLFFFLNGFYLNNSSHAAMKIKKNEGHKIVANLLSNAELNDGDVILIQYYDKTRFQKYFNFDKYIALSLNKGNFNQFITPDTSYHQALADGKNIYKEVFSTGNSEFFSKNLDDILLNKIPSGKKLAVVVFNGAALYSPVQIKAITQDEEAYKKTPLLFLIFSYMKNETLNECMEKLAISRYETKGSWAVVTFEK